MSIPIQVDERSKELGALIREARLAARQPLSKCAQLTGVESDVLHSWEEGTSAPSLPELEVLAYALQQPLQYFWSDGNGSKQPPLIENMNLPALIGIRQRMVGALLRQQRENASISLRGLAEQSGISKARLKAYEMGERPISLPELEGLLRLCSSNIESIFDQKGPIGQWMGQQHAVENFVQLSPELQKFVSQPGNRPYLELARKLSTMSADTMRAMAEDLVAKISQYGQ